MLCYSVTTSRVMLYLVIIVITTGILLLALHSNMLNIRVIIGDKRGVRRLGEREYYVHRLYRCLVIIIIS